MTRIATWLATCFGLGRFPVAPGTMTSAVATLCAVPLVVLGSWQVLAVAILVVIALGIPASGHYARSTLIYDPQDCVVDEVAGQWFALIPVATATRGGDWLAYVVAFAGFRFFDIWKPWPIHYAERLPGGAGIMADDIVAGLYAALVVFAALWKGWI